MHDIQGLKPLATLACPPGEGDDDGYTPILTRYKTWYDV